MNGPVAWDERVVRFEDGVELAQVQALLREMRERAGAVQDQISTLNLVAVYFTSAQYERAHGALEAAAVLQPSRLLVLVADETVRVDAFTARVSVARSEAGIATERIVLTATGRSVRHLESALEGLLLPELPRVVVWGGRPQGQLLRHVVESADRIIIDSGARSPRYLPETAKLLAQGAPIGDLAWARIFPWQSLAAGTLDLPTLREHRGNIRKARVVCAGGLGAEGVLLAGWMASRIANLEVELTAEGTALPPDEQEPPAPTAIPGPSPTTLGQVALLEFVAPPATFTFRRDRCVLVAQVAGDDDGACLHRVRLPPDTPGRLLSLELKLLSGVDELYAASMQAGVRLLGSA